jgi:hypothetical protein
MQRTEEKGQEFLLLLMGVWFKSSESQGITNCVEAKRVPGLMLVRDTQNRDAGHLDFSGSEWAALVAAVA